MIIHIVRHAEAIERTPEILEEHRYLTQRGRERFRKVVKTCKRSGVSPDIILTSPLTRAVQTADILSERLRYHGDLLLNSVLAPGFRPQALDQILSGHPDAEEIAIVGHEPDLGLVTQALLGEKEECALPKGGVVSFELRGGGHGEAVFVQMITGGGNLVTSRGKAEAKLKGLQGK